MDLLNLLLGLALVIGVVAGIYYGYTGAVRSVNDAALLKYGRRPVNLLNGLILVLPLGIFLMGLAMSETDISNLYVGTVIALIGIGWLTTSIAKKTDWGTATTTLLLLLIGIALSVFLILALMVMFSGGGKKSKAKR